MRVTSQINDISVPDIAGFIAALPGKVGDRAVFALSDLPDPRFVIPSGSSDKIAVRYYFQRFFFLLSLADPSDSELERLRSSLEAVSNSAMELVAGDGWNESDELTRAVDALTAVYHTLLLSGPLVLTPIPRPLIQLSLELQDTIHGRKSGLLHTIPSSIAATPGHRARRRRDVNFIPSKPDRVLPPFQRLVQLLGVSAEELALRRPEKWLQVCTDALTGVIVYLSDMGFSEPLLAPLRTLEDALLQMLHGRLSDLLHRRVWSDRFDAVSGDSEAPPGSKPELLQKERFKACMITAFDLHALAKRGTVAERMSFNQELFAAKLREGGRPVTYQSVKEARRRMWEVEKTLREHDHAAITSMMKRNGETAAPLRAGDLPVPSSGVRQLLQTAILFEPPEPILKLPQRGGASRR